MNTFTACKGPVGFELTEGQFRRIRDRVYDICRIKLNEGKQQLVKARLIKRIRHLGLNGFDEYIQYVEKDTTKNELSEMVDALTTNKTEFFREPAHFSFLTDNILGEFYSGTRRIWSAGCSSGEEPFSIAMTLREYFRTMPDVKILATDISNAILKKAKSASYEKHDLDDVNPMLRQRYFEFSGITGGYSVRPEIMRMIRFARLNLMGTWPMKRKFDVVFCRNVMIYFDKQTQEQLINRFWDVITDGGYLFVGHSESLAGLRHGFRYIQPAVYRK